MANAAVNLVVKFEGADLEMIPGILTLSVSTPVIQACRISTSPARAGKREPIVSSWSCTWVASLTPVDGGLFSMWAGGRPFEVVAVGTAGSAWCCRAGFPHLLPAEETKEGRREATQKAEKKERKKRRSRRRKAVEPVGNRSRTGLRNMLGPGTGAVEEPTVEPSAEPGDSLRPCPH